jgi:hypothetical protein
MLVLFLVRNSQLMINIKTCQNFVDKESPNTPSFFQGRMGIGERKPWTGSLAFKLLTCAQI